ncbi:hypothetical protein O7627_14210 [Solwaraspora sp. WMMD1047]|uniref:DoxX family protein n=1 Tax=Solwaraspora sp. WMMD1047 TaxID=3016102 RepID=UPI002417D80E|nr:hypothetical protein [Solwaraspora sp. WMMD1047]MDG4830452.1 hypothetical protein [Solwaraspora sp. WMMD1047]
MILLLPLILVTGSVRVGAGWLARLGVRAAGAWASWRAAAASGMAVVFVCTAATHFLEPQRSGLVAIVPSLLPAPDLLVTLTGLAELGLAAGLIVPRLRSRAALASVIFLIVIFPANVVAAAGVDHPDAPDTPLLPRTVLQLIFIAFAAAPLLPTRRRAGQQPRYAPEPAGAVSSTDTPITADDRAPEAAPATAGAPVTPGPGPA